ncbi:MAG: DUF86 domain-containing protein [Nitrospirae bacterium]|nr:DUF86 domain-containing protein [Nitrospirota bacterium]
MIDRPLIEKKLRKIEEFLRELEIAKIESYEEFKGNIVIKRFIERNLELAIEQMIDICKHLVSALDLKEPETFAECFDILAKGGIIPTETVSMFQSMVRFRNFLIHVYDGVDDSITYGIYMRHLGDFKDFIKVIRDYLQKK